MWNRRPEVSSSIVAGTCIHDKGRQNRNVPEMLKWFPSLKNEYPDQNKQNILEKKEWSYKRGDLVPFRVAVSWFGLAVRH